MLKKMYVRMRSRLYFIPGLYAIGFILLGIIFLLLDRNASERLSSFLPGFIFTSREIGSRIYSVMAGSLLTMLTITFSTMMVVLTIYGGQLSPRTLQDFLENPKTLSILGYFIGVLMYAVLGLFFMKPDVYEGSVLSPSIGIMLLMFAVFVFAFFIHYVSKSVQVTIYIQNLVRDTSDRIDRALARTEENPDIFNETQDQFDELFEEESIDISAIQSGFLQYFEEEKLFSLAKERDVIIYCDKRVGQHMLEGDVVFRLFNAMKVTDRDELEKKLSGMAVIGEGSSLYDDIGSGTQKLVEIAVRSLSPGINDPGTAVFCIAQIGYLLHKAAKGLDAKIYNDENGTSRLIVQGLTFDRLLYDHFYQIRHYSNGDLHVLHAMISALSTIAQENHRKGLLNQIWSFSQYLVAGIDYARLHEYDRAFLREHLFQLATVTRQNKSFDQLFQE